MSLNSVCTCNFTTECSKNCRSCGSETTCNGIGEACEETYIWNDSVQSCIRKYHPI